MRLKALKWFILGMSLLVISGCAVQKPARESFKSEKMPIAVSAMSAVQVAPVAKSITKVTLTWSSATKICGKVTLNDQKRIDQFAQIAGAGKPLADSDDAIIPRDGGSIVTAVMEDSNGKTMSVIFLLGTPASIGKECMVIQGAGKNYSADSALYAQLTAMCSKPAPPKRSAQSSSQSNAANDKKESSGRLLPEPKKTASDTNRDAEIVPRMPASEDIWNAAIGSDLYAGEYYDNEEGVLCFQVTNIKEAKKRIGSKDPYPYGPWKFVPAKYTFVQLQKARDILWEQRDKLEIFTMSDDVMNNGIRVSIPNTSKITLEDLIELTGIENINLTKYDPSKVKLPQDT